MQFVTPGTRLIWATACGLAILADPGVDHRSFDVTWLTSVVSAGTQMQVTGPGTMVSVVNPQDR